MFLLPEPEDAINEAMVEEEDRIQSSGVVLSHVAIGSIYRRKIGAWRNKGGCHFKSTNREVYFVMGRFEGYYRLAPIQHIGIPLLGGGRVGEHGVVWRVKAVL